MNIEEDPILQPTIPDSLSKESTLQHTKSNDSLKSINFDTKFSDFLKNDSQNNIDSEFITYLDQSNYHKLKEKFKINEIPIQVFSKKKNNLRILSVLGQGSFAKVIKAYDEGLKKNVALKYIKFNSFKDKVFQTSMQEVFILKLNEKSEQKGLFLNIYDVYIDESYFFSEGIYYLIIIMDLCQVNLFEILKFRNKINNPFTNEEILWIIYEINLGLIELKKIDVAHRDIKLDNILYSIEDNKFKITDFSESKIFQHNKINHNSEKILQTLKGTMAFMSPELYNNYKKEKKLIKLNYDPWKSDMYSLGLCAYCLFYSDYTILKERENLETNINALNCNEPIEKIIKLMLNINPELRISEKELNKIYLEENQYLDMIKIGKQKFIENTNSFINLIFEAKEIISDNIIDIVDNLCNIANISILLYNYNDARIKYTDALLKIDDFINNKNNDQSFLLKINFKKAVVNKFLAKAYSRDFLYKEAINFCEISSDLFKKIDIEKMKFSEKIEFFENEINLAFNLRQIQKFEESKNLLENLENSFIKYNELLENTIQIENDEDIKQIKNQFYINFVEIYNNLGCLKLNNHDSESAKLYYEKALNIFERNLIEKKGLQSKIRMNLSNSLYFLKDYKESINILENNLQVYKNDLIYNHPYTIICLTKLAKIYLDKECENLEIAQNYAQEALKIFKIIYKEYNNPRISFILEILAVCAKKKGNFKEAEKLFFDCYVINEKTLGFNPNTFHTIKRIIQFYSQIENYDSSIDFITKLIEQIEKLNENHEELLSYLLFQLKNLLYKTKQYDKSLIICEKTSVLEEKLAKNDKNRKKFVIENQIFLCKIYFITKEIRKEKKKTILRRIINSLKSLISTENEYKLKYSSKLEIIEKQLIDLN